MQVFAVVTKEDVALGAAAISNIGIYASYELAKQELDYWHNQGCTWMKIVPINVYTTAPQRFQNQITWA